LSLDPIISFLKGVDELVAAEALLDTFAKYAQSLEQLDELGRHYHDIKRYAKSIRCTEKALAIAPNSQALYALRANLAKLHNHINDPQYALFYLKLNAAQTPESPDVQLEQAFSLFLLGKRDESEQLLRGMAERFDLTESERDRVLFNLGTYDLYSGRFQEGLRRFLLIGKKLGIWKTVKLPLEFWDGHEAAGRTLVILAEGGYGDEFINVRFMKHLVDLGIRPMWLTSRKDLVPLFNRCGFETICSLGDAPKDALWTYSMSLPVYLNLNKKDLWYGPYLSADKNLVPKFDFISGIQLKVGIRWSGNPEYEHDLHRSVPLNKLHNAFRGIHCQLYSLQRDDGADEVKDYPDVHDLSTHLKTYDDTLAAISKLDIVVTSCTSIAHAAASLGKPVFVLTPLTEYYVWAVENKFKTYWYGDNVTMLKQVEHKDWTEPLENLRRFLLAE